MNVDLNKLVQLTIGLIVPFSAACLPAATQPPASAETAVYHAPTPKAESKPHPVPASPIRAIDFGNFTYPEIDSRGKFTLKDGRESTDDDPRGLVGVIYGDVIDDEKEEALVVHSQSIRGSAIPYFVYVYTMNGDKPKPVWSFHAGERGDGGLRQVYAEKGDIVVELYGRDRVVNGGTSVEEDNFGVCCPKYYTRSRYEWREGRFRLNGKEEAMPNPQGGAAYLPLLGQRGN